MHIPLSVHLAAGALLCTSSYQAGESFRVVDLCNSKACSVPEIVRKLELVKNEEERFSPDPQGHIKILVKFDRPVDKNSVVLGKTVIVDTPLDHAAKGKILWFSEEADSFTLIAEKPRAELFPPGKNNIDFIFTLRGNDVDGSGVIKSLEGDILDGNGDGKPGGDYKVHYKCADMDPFWCS